MNSQSLKVIKLLRNLERLINWLLRKLNSWPSLDFSVVIRIIYCIFNSFFSYCLNYQLFEEKLVLLKAFSSSM
jgi:hypothetical protein